MSDNNSANFPTSIDDYQPPQGMSVPAGINPPPAPLDSIPVNSQPTMTPAIDPALVAPTQVVPAPVVSDGPEVEPVVAEAPATTETSNPADFSQAFAKSAEAQKANQPKWTSDEMVFSVNGQVTTQKMSKLDRIIYGIDGEGEDKPTAEPTSTSEAASTHEPVETVEVAIEGPAPTTPAATQSLDAQNIFVLLGVNDGSNEEKEAFLDELQEVIWDDFLAHDCELLLTEAEFAELNQLKAKGKAPENQEEILIYLEKLIPDLEAMMLDKALELKEDMLLERIAGLREFYSQNADALQKVSEAEKATAEDRWADAASILNSIK